LSNEPLDSKISTMKLFLRFLLMALVFVAGVAFAAPKEPLFSNNLNTDIKPIGTDKSVKWDYDIVYVRAPRWGPLRGVCLVLFFPTARLAYFLHFFHPLVGESKNNLSHHFSASIRCLPTAS